MDTAACRPRPGHPTVTPAQPVCGPLCSRSPAWGGWELRTLACPYAQLSPGLLLGPQASPL